MSQQEEVSYFDALCAAVNGLFIVDRYSTFSDEIKSDLLSKILSERGKCKIVRNV